MTARRSKKITRICQVNHEQLRLRLADDVAVREEVVGVPGLIEGGAGLDHVGLPAGGGVAGSILAHIRVLPGAILTDADAARILDFSAPVPLPGGRSWTAHFRSWEPDRMQMIFFAVTVRDGGGGVLTTFETGIGGYDLDADLAGEPGPARRALDYRIRDRLGIPSTAPPYP